MSALETALALHEQDGAFLATIDPTWAQGRATFGGLVAALIVRAAGPGRLRSLALTFHAPAAPGPARLVPRVVRVGRAVRHVAVDVVQDDVVASARLVFGDDRPSRIHVSSAPPPPGPDAVGLPRLPFVPGVTPAFTQHFEFRWATGGFPFSGHGEPRMGGFIRPVDPTPVDVAVGLALLDAWPPPAFALLTGPAPGSTVSWHVVVVELPDATDVGGFYRYEGVATSAGGGFMDADARLWGPDGRLLLTARQLIAEFSG